MKTTTTIKAAAIATLLFTLSIFNFTAQGAVIQQVIVRQQWPWSTDVKVEYKLAEVTSPVDISVKAFNGDVELPLPVDAISGDLYGITESGIGQFVIDPVKAFGNAKVAIADFRVELEVSESAANVHEVLYKIFDLTNGGCTDVTRADLLNGTYGSVVTNFSSLGSGFSSPATDVLIWTGVTNDVKYKTTHLVMRKIPAKNQTFMMGSPTDEVGREYHSVDSGTEAQVNVRFTNDYYMAVFEMTQAQYQRIANASPSNYTGDDADYHPVEKISHNTLRGSTSSVGPSGEKINWPTNSYMHEVYSDSVMAKLRAKFSNAYEFDLPTSAQWEYACRAKTTTAFNNGKNLESISRYSSVSLSSVAWFGDTESGLTANTTHVVGLKAPNAWGLYDMHGNVNEFCLGGYVSNVNPEGLSELVDPPGFIIVPNGNCNFRGGSARSQSWLTRSAARSANNMQIWNGNTSSFLGVRLAFQVGADE